MPPRVGRARDLQEGTEAQRAADDDLFQGRADAGPPA